MKLLDIKNSLQSIEEVTIFNTPIKIGKRYTVKMNGGLLPNAFEAIASLITVLSPNSGDFFEVHNRFISQYKEMLQTGARSSKVILRLLTKEYGIKESASYYYKSKNRAVSDVVADICSEFTAKPDEVNFEFRTHMDWNNGDFGDSGSCYFTSYKQARRNIRALDGGAIVFYWSSGKPRGRCHYIKVNDYIAIFNIYQLSEDRSESYYSDIEARMPHLNQAIVGTTLSLFFNKKWKRINLSGNNLNPPMYINSGKGLILGEVEYKPESLHLETVKQKYPAKDLILCESCWSSVPESEYNLSFNRCVACVADELRSCNYCQASMSRQSRRWNIIGEDSHFDVCPKCLEAHFYKGQNNTLYFKADATRIILYKADPDSAFYVSNEVAETEYLPYKNNTYLRVGNGVLLDALGNLYSIDEDLEVVEGVDIVIVPLECQWD